MDAPVALLSPAKPKRIVLQRPDGIFQILGVANEQPDDLLPLTCDDGTQGPINLVASKRTFYLYRMVQSPSETMKTFHERQQ